jgi:hypothetical protein
MIDPETERKVRARLKTLKITELSAVSKPAQQGAIATIMKCQKSEDEMTAITKAQTDFSSVARDIAKRDGIAPYVAMDRARQERPDLFAKAYPGPLMVSRVAPEPSPAAVKIAKASGDFNAKVSEIAKRDGIAPYLAMDKARMEAPALFAAAYGR